MNYVPTLTDFILQEEAKAKNATGNFTILLTQIENAVKIIASHVRASGLVDILGKTGEENAFHEEVQKLDIFSNQVLVTTLRESRQVHAIVSEEIPKPHFVEKSHAGEYIVFFDPLDGSSNIDVNCPIGTIFSIYHKSDNLLQKGEKQVAAGYAIYGSSTMLVYTFGNGVNGFTLDPAIGSFLLSHPDIKIPTKGNIYSINEAYASFYDDSINNYLLSLKSQQAYKARYVGSLIADVHRTLLKGGIFLYPKDAKQPNGKLRLMIEVNPMSIIIKQAGGVSISNNMDPLTIVPKTIEDRAPVVLGSPENVAEYQKFI